MSDTTNTPFDEQVEQEADAYAKKGNPLVDPTKYYAFIAGAKSKAVQDKISELEKHLNGNYIFTPEQLEEHDLIVILKHEESKRATFKPLAP